MDEVRTTFGLLRPERELGRAWWLVASGDPSGACDVLSAAARDAVSSGHLTAASWLLHDMARLGQAGIAAEGLGALAKVSDSELVAARAAHARALVTSEPEALARLPIAWKRSVRSSPLPRRRPRRPTRPPAPDSPVSRAPSPREPSPSLGGAREHGHRD